LAFTRSPEKLQVKLRANLQAKLQADLLPQKNALKTWPTSQTSPSWPTSPRLLAVKKQRAKAGVLK
jgi:hypothetical protein